MKNIIFFLMIALLVFVLTACSPQNKGEQAFDSPFTLVHKYNNDWGIVRDPDTGCVYYMKFFDSMVIPYYNEDGEVDGCGDKDFNKDKYK